MYVCLLLVDLQRQINEREDQLQAMYSDPALQKVRVLIALALDDNYCKHHCL